MEHRAIRALALSACLLAAVPLPLSAQPAGPNAPPPAVVVTPVQVKDVAPVYTYIGRVQAIQTVDLNARVTAFIDSVDFPEGGDVQKDQVLFELEKAPYQAAVQAAEAQLKKAQAAYAQSEVALQRSQRLNQQGFEAQANLDQAIATRDSDAADVLAAQANLKTAGINLSYCTIRSPIDGRIGATTYTKGNLVNPSSKPLATVNQLDPIRVVFSVADRDLVTVQQRTNQAARQIADTLTVGLKLPNGTSYKQQGKIAFINNEVDPATGTISVWADFANPEHLLLPGTFVTVEIKRAEPIERPLVPVAAAQTEQQGSFVLLVGPDNKVKKQPVTLGRQIAQNFIVDQGLSGGERVIIQGVQKVHPGQVVNPTESTGAGQAATAQDGAGQGGAEPAKGG